MAGVLQALCDSEEMETLAYYLDCWRGVFAASSTAQAVGLFGAELAAAPRTTPSSAIPTGYLLSENR